MDTATARTPAFQRAVFEDALGTRHYADSPGGDPLELLEVRDEFNNESFERALRDRITALAGFRTTFFSQVRGVQRYQQNASRLFVVSDRVSGARLSSVLRLVRPQLDANATLCLIRQLVAAVALLHEKLPGIGHGALSPDRVVITPKARLVVVEHVLGSALEQLQYSQEKYWTELRVPLPPNAWPTFDQRADVMQIGMIALELILGRAIETEEFPNQISELVERPWHTQDGDGIKPLPAELRAWLMRTLQLEGEQSFASAGDAWAELEHALVGRSSAASFASLESAMAEYARIVVRDAVSPVTSAVATLGQGSPAPSKVVQMPNMSSRVLATASAQPATPVPVPAPAPAALVASQPIAAEAAGVPSVPQPAAEERVPEVALPFAQTIATPAPAFDTVTEGSGATSSGRGRLVAIVAALVLVVGGGAFAARQYLMAPAVAPAPGTLVVNTNPAGFQVFIDGQPRGATPLTLELAAGAHELKIASEGEPRVIPITITSGGTVAQTIELPKAAPRTGQLTVRSEPAGARVTIDGTASGVAPLTLEGLTPGTHKVTLESDLSSVTQEVIIEAGTTASLVVPMTAPQGVPVSGWVSVDAPAEVQLFEGGNLVGTSQSDRVMVTAGRHDFEIVNATLGYRAKRTVTVAPGKVSTLRLDWPKGSVAVNAQPWADVWIGGERVGETPIGNVTLPIGTHEITFRHPELGEQVVRATVTATAPARVSVDMRKR